jgi:hypothetical protein
VINRRKVLEVLKKEADRLMKEARSRRTPVAILPSGIAVRNQDGMLQRYDDLLDWVNVATLQAE